MSKDAILMMVDVGHSMDQSFSDSTSRAKVALECCKLTLQQKIFNNSSHEIGLLLFGDNQSDDGNSLILQEIQKPSIEFVRKVQKLSCAHFQNTKAGGDIFSAINFGVKQIADHCGKKKYNKRLFIFTNGMGRTDWAQSQLKSLVKKINSNGIKLNVIPIDFMVTYDIENNVLEGEYMTQPLQEVNAQLLMRLKDLQNENIQIFPASLAIELYKKFRKKDTNPVALFKGALEIAPGLNIQVSTYKAIRRYDASAPFNPFIPQKNEKEVITEVNHIVQGDDSGTIIDKEHMINAFSYGPQLVPMGDILEVGSKIFEEKNFRLLGFVQKSKIPRHSLMGQVDIVIPSDNAVSRKLFTSFIYSMISLNRYGIARYVPRNNKNGVNPKMVALIPYRSSDRQMFYLVQLPTIEDMKEYPFNSLKESTDKQKEIVKDLVHNMMLFHKDEERQFEEIKVQNTFNPVRQYFYQSIFYRALNNNQVTQIPPLDAVIKNYISPQLQKFEDTRNLMPGLRKQFKLNKKLDLSKAKEKKNVMWKDIITDMDIEKESTTIAEQMDEQVVKPKFHFNMDDEDEQYKFQESNPILSFKKMINYNKKDLVNEAVTSLTQYIDNKRKFVISDQDYKNLIECSSELRQGCVSQKEESYWDGWFKKLSYEDPSCYEKLRREGIGYINEDNVEVFKPVELHHDELEEVICDLD